MHVTLTAHILFKVRYNNVNYMRVRICFFCLRLTSSESESVTQETYYWFSDACTPIEGLHTCNMAGDSASGVAGDSSLMSLRPPTSPLVPILSNACSLRFSLFSIRANACRIASIFLSSRVYMNDRQKERRQQRKVESYFLADSWEPS